MSRPFQDSTPHHLLAGAAQVDITPPLGTFINGDFLTHYAQHIHDSLYAKALVFQCHDVETAIVVVDICVMPKDFLDAVRQDIAGATGIPFAHILVSSTHTHAAGSVASVYLAAADLLYAKKLPPLIVQAVKKAKQNLRPARVGFGKVDVPQHVRCRRYLMHQTYAAFNPVTGELDQVKTNPFDNGHLIQRAASEADPQVRYLAVQGVDGAWISVLGNYSLHYVGDWPNGSITADYFGVFASAIGQKLAANEGFVGIMSNGTSGDINIWEFVPSNHYPAQSFQKSAYIGNDIAEKVYQSLSQIQWEWSPSIAVQYKELMIRTRKPSPDELEKAREIVAQGHFESLVVDDAGLRSLYAREQILLNELPDELSFPLQAIRIGSGIIGGLGGEIFAETGLWLKRSVGAIPYFTIGLANGNLGYVPPAHDFSLGGYETWRSRASKLNQQAEALIREHQLALIQQLAGVQEQEQAAAALK